MTSQTLSELDQQFEARVKLASAKHAIDLQTCNRKLKRTCSECSHYCKGLCRLKAAADWGDSSFVKPTRSACHFADLRPF
ncbi:MAG: hypothetical protein KME10_11360 [Plectolyngbya sp. WJT66-NPBG17]|jgi:hypothetical protein|nr:hypothetical protein [Plectolyngbya sp. WJT66-NPBG17]